MISLFISSVIGMSLGYFIGYLRGKSRCSKSLLRVAASYLASYLKVYGANRENILFVQGTCQAIRAILQGYYKIPRDRDAVEEMFTEAPHLLAIYRALKEDH